MQTLSGQSNYLLADIHLSKPKHKLGRLADGVQRMISNLIGYLINADQL
jgi:hypothetical protein